MKTETCQRSPSSATARTRPSAAETTPAPGVRSGSRKNQARNRASSATAAVATRNTARNGSRGSNDPRTASRIAVPTTGPTIRLEPGANTGASGLEDDFDVDAVGDLDPHHLAERPL